MQILPRGLNENQKAQRISTPYYYKKKVINFKKVGWRHANYPMISPLQDHPRVGEQHH